MNWINKLERKFERYAIHNLMHYIIILYAVGFVLNLIAPGSVSYTHLDVYKRQLRLQDLKNI